MTPRFSSSLRPFWPALWLILAWGLAWAPAAWTQAKSLPASATMGEDTGRTWHYPPVSPADPLVEKISSKTSEKIMNGPEQIGVRTKCKVVKNKVAPPFKTCEFDMIYGLGISKVGEILDLAVELDICKKSGAWFYYGDMRLGQGRENAKQYLLDNRDLMDEIEKKVREKSDEIDMSADLSEIAGILNSEDGEKREEVYSD